MNTKMNDNNFCMECLRAAISYCKSQYESSGIDWLPSTNFIGIDDEAAKFVLLEDYLRMFEENINKFNIHDSLNHNHSDEDCRMLMEAELVKQLLIHSSYVHGAKIKIVVEHDNGHTATAELYDHAALVESLINALTYFQREMV